MGDLEQRQEILTRLQRPQSYPGRDTDLARFLELDRQLYHSRLTQLSDVQLRQEYLSVHDRLAAGDVSELTEMMLAERGFAAAQEVTTRSGLPQLSEWHEILNFQPNAQGLQPLVAADGTRVNLDYYSVAITHPPLAPDGHPMSPAEMLDAIRTDFNGMLKRGGVLGPYNHGFAKSVPLVRDTPPDGLTIHINLSMFDDGTVALTENTTQHFRFSTVIAWNDLEHPVSGHRDFGYETGPADEYRVYTRGADRPTGELDNELDFVIFHGSDQMWPGWQRGIAAWVIQHGGGATIMPPVIHHVAWSDVDTFLYRHDNHLWEQAAHAGLEHGAPLGFVDPHGPAIDLDALQEAPSLDPSIPFDEYSLDPSEATDPIDWTPADPENEISEAPH